MSYRYHTADVFTSTPFGGNQLAVLPDARGLTDQQMTSIAREFNFSESVFVFPPDDKSHTRRLRIFTPGGELPFAGHPTVGTAFVLAVTGELQLTGDETRIVFEEGVGPVPVVIRAENGNPVFAQLSAARIPESSACPYEPASVAQALSLSPDDILQSPHAIESWSVGLPFLIVPLRDRDALARSRVNTAVWNEVISGDEASQVFLFTQIGDEIFARMYMPGYGIPEDPATGSAVASLGGYLSLRSDVVDGTLKFIVHQGVEMGRPSLLELEVDLAGGSVTAVRVGGASVLISSGTLHVP